MANFTVAANGTAKATIVNKNVTMDASAQFDLQPMAARR